jgi:hypothetical protein
MFADLAKVILEFLKLAPRYLIALGIAATVLLFGSEDFLKKIGVFDFVQNYRPWLGLTLVATASLFAVSVGSDVLGSIRKWKRKRVVLNRIAQRLDRLTEDEKQILRYYFAKQTRANTLRIDDGVVQGLVADGIIYRSASLGSVVEGFAHNISDIAWDYLYVNPHLLKGETNVYRTDKRERRW